MILYKQKRTQKSIELLRDTQIAQWLGQIFTCLSLKIFLSALLLPIMGMSLIIWSVCSENRTHQASEQRVCSSASPVFLCFSCSRDSVRRRGNDFKNFGFCVCTVASCVAWACSQPPRACVSSSIRCFDVCRFKRDKRCERPSAWCPR